MRVWTGRGRFGLHATRRRGFRGRIMRALASREETMSIWKQQARLEDLNRWSAGSADSHLGIEYTDIGADYLRGRMPVDERTRQPFGLLHGGANVLLAESLGSMAGWLASGEKVVGLEINANHLRAVRDGFVTGTARPIHVGRATQVWEIRIEDERGKLACLARLTLMVLPKGAE
jgi:uncharacterized protein (TIGR00369 family)